MDRNIVNRQIEKWIYYNLDLTPDYHVSNKNKNGRK